MLNHGALLQLEWDSERLGQGWLARDGAKRLRRKMVDDADDSRYVREPFARWQRMIGYPAHSNARNPEMGPEEEMTDA